MFGGAVTNDGLDTLTNNVYIFNVTHNTIVSYYYHVYSTCLLSHISFIISRAGRIVSNTFTIVIV